MPPAQRGSRRKSRSPHLAWIRVAPCSMCLREVLVSKNDRRNPGAVQPGRTMSRFAVMNSIKLVVMASALLLSAHGALSQDAPAKVYAFAKASPLQVADNSASPTETHPQSFEFGKAYEATEEPPGYVKIKLRDDKFVYVRATYVTTMRTPRWLATTSGYNRPERAKVQFWESGVKLNEFISGTNRAGSQYDYEEFFFDTAPGFQLKLPILERDSVDLLDRQVK